MTVVSPAGATLHHVDANGRIQQNAPPTPTPTRAKLPKCITQDIAFPFGYHLGYREKSHLLSFCTTVIPHILLRMDGSVLPRIALEVVSATAVAVAAVLYERELDDQQWDSKGHQIVGTLLAFLTVFRTSFAWSMYQAGFSGVSALRNHAGNLLSVALGPMLAECARASPGPAALPDEAYDLCRLLKLFSFLTISHLRASDGDESREWCRQIAYSFATDAEISELEAIGGAEAADALAFQMAWLAERREAGRAATERVARTALGESGAPPRSPQPARRKSKFGLPRQWETKNAGRAKVLRSLTWLHAHMRQVEMRSPRGPEYGGCERPRARR